MTTKAGKASVIKRYLETGDSARKVSMSDSAPELGIPLDDVDL